MYDITPVAFTGIKPLAEDYEFSPTTSLVCPRCRLRADEEGMCPKCGVLRRYEIDPENAAFAIHGFGDLDAAPDYRSLLA